MAQASAQLGRGMVPSFDGKAKIAAEALLDRVRVGSKLGFEPPGEVQGPTAYFAESRESRELLHRCHFGGGMHAASAWVQALAVWLWSGTEYVRRSDLVVKRSFALWAKAKHPFAPLVASYVLSGASILVSITGSGRGTVPLAAAPARQADPHGVPGPGGL